MEASDLIKTIFNLRSDGIQLPSEQEDNEYLQKIEFAFTPSKKSFEDLLGSSVILLEYVTNKKMKKQALCTSNKTLINVFQKIKQFEKRKAAKQQSGVIRGKDPSTVQTWDLASNHIIEIPINIPFNLKPNTIKYKIILRNTPENILAVDQILKNFLNK